MSRSHLFPALVALGAILPLAHATSGTANSFEKNVALAGDSNYSRGAPNAGQDISLTTSSTALTLTSTTLYFGSLNVTNRTAYTVSNSSITKDSLLSLGGGGTTNGTSGANGADLIYLSNHSSLTLLGPNSSLNSYFTLSLRLAAAGNFNVGAGSTLTLTTEISGSNALGITGAGTVNLAGYFSNTFSGPVTVSAGTLNLAKTNGATALAGDLTVAGGTVNFQQSNQLTSGRKLTVSGGTADLGATNQAVGAVVLSAGRISGTGTLTGTGYTITGGALDARLGGGGAMRVGGAATLAGANTGWSGAITIAEGGRLTPMHDAALGKGGVTVNAGGTLELNGRSLGNAITVQGGGVFTGGGTLTGPLTLQAGAIYAWTLGDGVTLGAGGSATLTSGALLSVASLTPTSFATATNQSWTVFAGGAGSITGTALTLTGVSPGFTGLGSFTTSLANGDLVLKWVSGATAVPEPATGAALAGALVLAGAFIWRRRRRTKGLGAAGSQ